MSGWLVVAAPPAAKGELLALCGAALSPGATLNIGAPKGEETLFRGAEENGEAIENGPGEAETVPKAVPGSIMAGELPPGGWVSAVLWNMLRKEKLMQGGGEGGPRTE